MLLTYKINAKRYINEIKSLEALLKIKKAVLYNNISLTSINMNININSIIVKMFDVHVKFDVRLNRMLYIINSKEHNDLLIFLNIIIKKTIYNQPRMKK